MDHAPMRRLPPLNAVVCFEAVARLGGVREAANTLCVTPSAVSHQLAKLEAHLGTPLFHRRNRRLVPTDAGRVYLQQVGGALDRLEQASWDATDERTREVLSVSMPPSFTALWMMPRLGLFRRRHPELDLQFIEQVAVEEARDMPDCAIEYRLAAPRDRLSEVLFEDHIVPLAAPALVRRANLTGPESLRGQTLIDTERRFASWRSVLGDPDWLKDCPKISVRFSHQAFHAAMFGLGVALGNRYNAAFFIDEGYLQSPFALPGAGPAGGPRYFFSMPGGGRPPPKVTAFRDWLRGTAAAQRAA